MKIYFRKCRDDAHIKKYQYLKAAKNVVNKKEEDYQRPDDCLLG